MLFLICILTEDVKKALQAKGVDISAVADRGPKEPVVVIPVSIIMQNIQGASPEESMKQFVQDMTANAQQLLLQSQCHLPAMLLQKLLLHQKD